MLVFFIGILGDLFFEGRVVVYWFLVIFVVKRREIMERIEYFSVAFSGIGSKVYI